jgi:hypothetical protein
VDVDGDAVIGGLMLLPSKSGPPRAYCMDAGSAAFSDFGAECPRVDVTSVSRLATCAGTRVDGSLEGGY